MGDTLPKLGSAVTINCNLTESDYRAMRRYFMFSYRKLHWFIGVVLISLLVFNWFGHKHDATLTEKIFGLIGLTVLWAATMLIFLLVWKVIARFTGGRFRGSVGPHVFEVSDEVFTESNADGKIETRLAGIRHVAETPAYFFVLTTTGRGHVIPKKDLSSLDALRSLQLRVAKRRAVSPG
jgi:hypothetical protein